MVQLWEKIKSQYGSASNAFSNLTISGGEEDGATETDTVVHNALLKYYVSKGQQVPQWLGVEVTPQYRHSLDSRLPASNATTESYIPRQGITRTNTQSSSLQDIYNRHPRGSTSGASQTAAPVDPREQFRMPARSQSFNQPPGEKAPGSVDRSDRFRNKLRSGARAQW